jgi:glycosyltransferase involved in cell wall biosynthesis
MQDELTISVVVPVYNSEATLVELIQRLTATLRQIGVEYEILLVNDGSRDQSWRTIQQICEANRRVLGISLMRNYGQHNALLCGIRRARYQITVTLDDDLQNPPEEIPCLLSKLSQGFDVVYGYPEREQHGMWRDVASRITKLALQSVMGVETARHVSAYRMFRTRIRKSFAAYQGPFVSIDTLLTWGTSRFGWTVVKHDERVAGTSNYTMMKLLVHALNMMTGFSAVPLQVASIVGFLFTLFGIAVFAFVMIRYLIQGTSVPGFPFLASVIAIFSGAQLFALGIIGEYLARMHFRLMDRPPYAIGEDTAPVASEDDKPSMAAIG